jgi:hypothetical protein
VTRAREWRVAWGPDDSVQLVGPAASAALLKQQPWRIALLAVICPFLLLQLVVLAYAASHYVRQVAVAPDPLSIGVVIVVALTLAFGVVVGLFM